MQMHHVVDDQSRELSKKRSFSFPGWGALRLFPRRFGGCLLVSFVRCFSYLWCLLFCFFFFFFISALSKLVDPLVINLVFPALVKPDEEDHIITKGSESMECGHFDGEGKKVIDKRVEEFVRESFSGHVCDRLDCRVNNKNQVGYLQRESGNKGYSL